MMVDWRALRYLSEVVRQGSFTRAAEILHVTQPTISKMIKLLEDDLGTSLLIRGPRSVQPTEAGRVVYRHAQQILRQFQGLNSEMDGLKGLIRGELRLGMPPVFMGSMFIREIGRFHRQYPGIGLSIGEYGGTEMVNRIQNGEIDVGVTSSQPDPEQFERLTLYEDEVVLVVPADNRWAGMLVPLAELKDEKFVLFPEGYYANLRFRQACEASGFEPDVVCHTAQWEFLMCLADAGLGLATMPLIHARRLDPSRLAIVRILPEIHYTMGLLWRAGGCSSFATRAFVTLVREVLAEKDFLQLGAPILG